MNIIKDLSKSNKVAVVFHGIVSGSLGRNGVGDPIDYKKCAALIKHNLLKDIDCDIFMHSWSIEHEKEILDIYKPKMSLFEPQEMFGFNFTPEMYQNEDFTHGFRTLSRYESLYRAMNLKKQYELDNDFKYDWVIVLRFDLVVLNKIDFIHLNKDQFYVCNEPHWGDIHNMRVVHDIIFLSNSEIMDQFSNIADDICAGRFHDLLPTAHKLAYEKLLEILPSSNQIQYLCKRFDDLDIYRFVVNPDLNELGKQYGGLYTNERMISILKEINYE